MHFYWSQIIFSFDIKFFADSRELKVDFENLTTVFINLICLFSSISIILEICKWQAENNFLVVRYGSYLCLFSILIAAQISQLQWKAEKNPWYLYRR